MLVPFLVVCLLATTPIAVYAISTWPDAQKTDREEREQRERFFDQLSARQAVRREMMRSDFDGEERSRSNRTQ